MSLRSALQNAMAHAALQACKATGVQVSFDNLNGSPVTLWAMPLEGLTSEGAELGSIVDNTERVWSIPRQTNFPPDSTDEATYGIRTDALLTFPASGGQVYSARSIQADSLGATFRLTTKRTIAKRTGAQ